MQSRRCTRILKFGPKPFPDLELDDDGVFPMDKTTGPATSHLLEVVIFLGKTWIGSDTPDGDDG